MALSLAAASLAADRAAHADPPPDSSVVHGLHVVGNQLRDDNDDVVQLRGVDVTGSEYACIEDGGWGFTSGLDDPADRERALDAMQTWAINTVRVPLNSDCWFGTKPELAGDPWVGAPYRAVMTEWIDQITARGMVAVADLHWTAPDGYLAIGQSSMTDDTSVAFWHDVAATFGSDPNVVFDLFNEPYLNREYEEGTVAAGSDVTDPDAAWACWLDGCTATRYDLHQTATAATYQATGMQELVDAVRSEGATNVLLVAGLGYSQYFDRLTTDTLPVVDPLDDVAISFHAYPGNPCGLDKNACRADAAALASHHPVIVGEYGRSDCKTTNIENFLDFADGNGISYLAWQWLPVPYVKCTDGDKFELTKDAFTGAPSIVGAAVKAHYLERAQSHTHVLVTTTSIANGLAGKAYKSPLSAAGGKGPYHWTVAGGALPPGLKLSTNGVVSGTPVGPGSSTVVVQVLDSTRPVKYGDFQTLTVTVDPMTVATTSLPTGVTGQSYKGKLLTHGGKGFLKWTIDAGTLPPGLKMSASGSITGKPTTPGSYALTFRATDGTRPTANSATADLVIDVL